MSETDTEMDRLCNAYENLNDMEKGKIIRLAEGLLKSQNVLSERLLSIQDLTKCECGKKDKSES